MVFSKALSAVQALFLIQSVAGHGIVRQAVVGSNVFQGYDNNFSYNPQSAPPFIGWSTGSNDRDLGYVSDPSTADIICHKQATSGTTHGTVAAGEKVTFLWKTGDGAPYVHPGPMMTYMANCNGPCESVDKSSLKFFKIDEAGLQIPASTWQASIWAANQMAKANNSWTSIVPSDIAPGNYVIRHETIAIHSAGQVGGAQFYPQCMNFVVTGTGTANPPGVVGTSLYTANDPGVLVNIYYPVPQTYKIPGPALYGSGGGSAGQGTGGSSVPAANSVAPAGQGAASGGAPPLYALPSNKSMTTSSAAQVMPAANTMSLVPVNTIRPKPLNFIAVSADAPSGCASPVTVTVTPTPVTVTVTAGCAGSSASAAAAGSPAGGKQPGSGGSGGQPAVSPTYSTGAPAVMASASVGAGPPVVVQSAAVGSASASASASVAAVMPAVVSQAAVSSMAVEYVVSSAAGAGQSTTAAMPVPSSGQPAAVIPVIPCSKVGGAPDAAGTKTTYSYNPILLNSSMPQNLTNVAINTTLLPSNVTKNLPDLPARLNITGDAPPLPANASWKDFWAWLMQVVENSWFKGGSQPAPGMQKRHSRMFKDGQGYHF